ncbi:hypothetical protein KKG71_00035 [Patescibacteria group bacterium]|nr:hypothetical protein [Patescibacteria group bacterium]
MNGNETIPSSTQEITSGDNRPIRPRERTESIEMVLAELEHGSGIGSKLNTGHIDKLLDQRSDIIDKVHQDRKDERWDSKFYYVGGATVILSVLAAVFKFAPEYISQAITALFAGSGGFGAGYGFGKR